MGCVGLERSLVNVETGSTIYVKDIKGNGELRFRLYYMGLYPNMRLTVVRNDGFNPVIVEVQGSLIAISRDLAERVLVELAEENEVP